MISTFWTVNKYNVALQVFMAVINATISMVSTIILVIIEANRPVEHWFYTKIDENENASNNVRIIHNYTITTHACKETVFDSQQYIYAVIIISIPVMNIYHQLR